VVCMSMQCAQPLVYEARSLTSPIHNGSLGLNPCSSSGSDPTCSNTKNRTGRFANNFVKMRYDSSKRALAEAPANHGQVLCSAITRSLLQNDRFRKVFRSEMLKRHVTRIDLAEGVHALPAND
jgi:hypothetical protein